MARFRKKPVVVEANQWFKKGDHPEVIEHIVPECGGLARCRMCWKTMEEHGWINTLEGSHIVCPGDWIITGIKNENYACKPHIFVLTYEPVGPEQSD